MKKPKISFIVIFCNQNHYISRALESIIQVMRGYDDFEIIVGIDNADDEAINIARPYKLRCNAAVHLLQSDARYVALTRASSNRAYLLKQARGTYALLLDGDDFYINSPLEAINFLEKNPSFVGYAHNYKEYDETNNSFRDISPPYDDGAIISLKTHLKEKKYITSNCIVFRRAVLDGHLERYCNDTAMTCHLLSKGAIKYSRKSLMGYSIGIPSIFSGQSRLIQCLSSFLMREKLIQMHPQYKKYFYRQMFRTLRKFRKSIKGVAPHEFIYQSNECSLFYTKKLCDICTQVSPIKNLNIFYLLITLRFRSL